LNSAVSNNGNNGNDGSSTNLNNSTASAHLNVYKPTFIINNSYQPGQTSSSNDLRTTEHNQTEGSEKHPTTESAANPKKSGKRGEAEREMNR
jgi:hypothetical protein